MNLQGNKKGFTLIELIIIIIILGILAAVAIPKYLDMRQDAVNATVKAVLGGMRGANSVLWGNRVIQNNTASYDLNGIVYSMEMKGGMITTVAADGLSMTMTVGASSYQFTIGDPKSTPPAATSAQPPTTPIQIYLATVGGVAVAGPQTYTMW